jgi:hypothetical protein
MLIILVVLGARKATVRVMREAICALPFVTQFAPPPRLAGSVLVRLHLVGMFNEPP